MAGKKAEKPKVLKVLITLHDEEVSMLERYEEREVIAKHGTAGKKLMVERLRQVEAEITSEAAA